VGVKQQPNHLFDILTERLARWACAAAMYIVVYILIERERASGLKMARLSPMREVGGSSPVRHKEFHARMRHPITGLLLGDGDSHVLLDETIN
jgi:hypothetical protein